MFYWWPTHCLQICHLGWSPPCFVSLQFLFVSWRPSCPLGIMGRGPWRVFAIGKMKNLVAQSTLEIIRCREHEMTPLQWMLLSLSPGSDFNSDWLIPSKTGFFYFRCILQHVLDTIIVVLLMVDLFCFSLFCDASSMLPHYFCLEMYFCGYNAAEVGPKKQQMEYLWYKTLQDFSTMLWDMQYGTCRHRVLKVGLHVATLIP